MGHMGHDGLFILLKISEMSYAQRFIVEPKNIIVNHAFYSIGRVNNQITFESLLKIPS